MHYTAHWLHTECTHLHVQVLHFQDLLCAHTVPCPCPFIIHLYVYILLFALSDSVQTHAAYILLWTLLMYVTYPPRDPVLLTQFHALRKHLSTTHINST
jgi:hypothetical protein